MTNARTKIVPAHGPGATRTELLAYKSMLVTIARTVRKEMKAGRTREEIVASHPAAAYRGGMEGEEDRLVETIYDSYRVPPAI